MTESLDPAAIADRLEEAIRAARDAGAITREHFGQRSLAVQRKADNSPVTIADRAAEQLLRNRIMAAFPADGIIGEEYGQQEGSSAFRWILDPIDGTTAFISGVPLYGTLVGVECQGRSVAGVIYMPALDECVYAAQGSGAWHVVGSGPPQRARVSSCAALADGLFVTSQVDLYARRGAEPVFQTLQQRAYITRTWGDCYGYLLVATGRAAVMVDPMLNVWDAAALQPILEEAGGTFTDWQGQPTIFHQEGIGSNGRVLPEILAVTGPFGTPAQAPS